MRKRLTVCQPEAHKNSQAYRGSRVRSLLSRVYLSCVACAFVAGVNARSETINFNIPAQPVPSALSQYAHQADVQIAFLSEGLENVNANSLIGAYGRQEALDLLLDGTGLEARFLPDFTVRVRRAARSDESLFTSAVNSAFALALFADSQKASHGSRQSSRLAAESQGESQGDPGDTFSDAETIQDRPKELSPVVVTGTQIRGSGPVGADVITITRDDIERDVYATTQQIIQNLPQNFQGGPNEDIRTGRGSSLASNLSSGSSANLRGLGAGSTLILVNGRRQPSAGADAAFVDVSAIPLTAIDRIEVLPDGASAIYGSDAIGGVINVVLVDDFEGAETKLRFGPDIGNDFIERQFGQVLGKSWGSGNIVATYEFYERTDLSNEDRSYAANGDLTPFGGDNFNSTASNPGNFVSLFTGEPTFAIPKNQDGTSLEFDDLLSGVTNFQNIHQGGILLPGQEQHSAFLSLSQSVTAGAELFLETRYRDRDFDRSIAADSGFLFIPASNAFVDEDFLTAVNGIPLPFALVEYSFIDDVGPVRLTGDAKTASTILGAGVDIGKEWHLESHVNYARQRDRQRQGNVVDRLALSDALADSDPATAFNALGDGSNTNPATIARIVTSSSLAAESELRSVNVTGEGPIPLAAFKRSRLAAGLDYREESIVFESMSTFGSATSDGDREVYAMFSELLLPFGEEGDGATPYNQDLAFSIAVRFEKYSDFGTTVNPKFGVSWSPKDNLKFRGTYGSSFKAPGLRELNEPASGTTFTVNLNDPQSPTGSTNVLLRIGTNPALQEETADIWTAGIEFRPRALSAFNISANYFDIQYEDRIARPDNLVNVLVQEDRFDELIVRNPTQGQLDELCAPPAFTGDPASCQSELVGAIVDARLNNASRTKTRGVDVQVSANVDTNAGYFGFSLNGTYILGFDEAFSSTSPETDLLDSVGNPIDLRIRGGVFWSLGGFDISAYVNYADNYVDDVSIPERRIDSHITLDLQLNYRSKLGADSVIFDDWRVALNVQNLFNDDPPFVNTALGGFDPRNASPFGRVVTVQALKGF